MGHLVAVFDQIFKAAKLGARLDPYEIMATSPTAGVIEVRGRVTHRGKVGGLVGDAGVIEVRWGQGR